MKIDVTDLKEGYIPRTEFEKGVFIKDCLVTNHSNTIIVPVSNITDKEVHVILPILKLDEVEKIS